MSKLQIFLNGHVKVSLTILSRLGKYNGYFYEIFHSSTFSDSNDCMTVSQSLGDRVA